VVEIMRKMSTTNKTSINGIRLISGSAETGVAPREN